MADEQNMAFGGDDAAEGLEIGENDLSAAMSEHMGLGEVFANTELSNHVVKDWANRVASSGDVLDDINTSVKAGREGPNERNTGVESSEQEESAASDGESEKEFETKEDYLQWKVGNDGRKWGEEKSELLQRIAKLEGRMEAGSNGQQEQMMPNEVRGKVKELLFQNASQEELDAGMLTADTVADAFIQNGQLIGNNMAQFLQPIVDRIDKMESGLGEMSARTKHNIDPGVEQKLLQKHPYLKNLNHEERMAVLADLGASGAAKASNRSTTSVPRQKASEHVEASVQSTPNLGAMNLDDLKRDFDKHSTKDQLNILSGIVKTSPEARTLFQPPSTF